MTTFAVLLSLLLPVFSGPADAGVSTDQQPIRYRGIEKLLAKFESE
jgi:hypothetical protein